jgi:hypothetical protein
MCRPCRTSVRPTRSGSAMTFSTPAGVDTFTVTTGSAVMSSTRSKAICAGSHIG